MKISLFSLLILLLYTANAHAIRVRVPLDMTGAVAEQTPGSSAAYPAAQALDGNVNSRTQTPSNSADPWLSFTLPEPRAIEGVVITNRWDGYRSRMRDLTVTAYADAEETIPVFTSEVLNPGNVLGSPTIIKLEFPANLQARKIKIRRDPASPDGPGELSLSEVELYTTEEMALPPGTVLTRQRAGLAGLTATQSSTWPGLPASLALDGDTNNIASTNAPDSQAWWEVDFGAETTVEQVLLRNRNNCCQGRLKDLTVTFYNNNHEVRAVLSDINPQNILNNPATITLDLLSYPEGTGEGVRYVRVARAGNGTEDGNILSLAEVQITGSAELSVIPPELPLPELSVSLRPDNQIHLSWPGETSGYLLETTVDLQSPWTTVDGVAGNSITLPAEGERRFYRLRKKTAIPQ